MQKEPEIIVNIDTLEIEEVLYEEPKEKEELVEEVIPEKTSPQYPILSAIKRIFTFLRYPYHKKQKQEKATSPPPIHYLDDS